MYLTRTFMTTCNLTVHGYTTPISATFGCLMLTGISGLMPAGGTGCKPITAPHGYLIIPGDGLRSTTAGGVTMIILDGNGYPAKSGRLHGLAGATVAVIMAGRL